MSKQIIIKDETALEIKAAIQSNLEQLKEFGVYIDVKGIYFNNDSFYVNVQGQTNPEKPFDNRAKRKYLS